MIVLLSFLFSYIVWISQVSQKGCFFFIKWNKFSPKDPWTHILVWPFPTLLTPNSNKDITDPSVTSKETWLIVSVRNQSGWWYDISPEANSHTYCPTIRKLYFTHVRLARSCSLLDDGQRYSMSAICLQTGGSSSSKERKIAEQTVLDKTVLWEA